MTRLSIILPAQRNFQPFEETLVSVLENRPDDSEIVAVVDPSYDDPYELADEVKLIDAPRRANLAACIELGWKVSSGDVVHILAPGMRAGSAWCEPAMAAFEAEEDLAAVAPLIVRQASTGEPDAAARENRTLSAGLAYKASGTVVPLAYGKSPAEVASLKLQPQAAPLMGGFFLRDAVDEAGGFVHRLGLDAGLEMGLLLADDGWLIQSVPQSIVLAGDGMRQPSALNAALCRNRLFWRNRHRYSSLAAFAPQPWHLMLRTLETVRRPMTAASWIGRFLALTESSQQKKTVRSEVRAASTGGRSDARQTLKGPHAARGYEEEERYEGAMQQRA